MAIVDPVTAGDPMSKKRWIVRSLASIQRELVQQAHQISHETIRRLLRQRDIRPKANIKRLVAKPNPQRNQQFEYIQQQRALFSQAGWPCISVDCKKKELIGNFAQAGQRWQRAATAVYMHDFPSHAQGRAVPYGIYDLQQQSGYVYIGRSAETAEFAVESILAWWQTSGQILYPDAPELLILADGGGSNGYRTRLWKEQLQVKLVDGCDLTVTVLHYPTGASKWNPIEHRLFSQITNSFAGTPLTSFELMRELVATTTTDTGLTVHATLNPKPYLTGIKVSDAQMASLLVDKHDTCPAWSYTIRPRLNREVIS